MFRLGTHIRRSNKTNDLQPLVLGAPLLIFKLLARTPTPGETTTPSPTGYVNTLTALFDQHARREMRRLERNLPGVPPAVEIRVFDEGYEFEFVDIRLTRISASAHTYFWRIGR